MSPPAAVLPAAPPGQRAGDGSPAAAAATVPAGQGQRGWRRYRGLVALIAAILVASTVVALIQLGPPVTGPLDPNDPGPGGTHALADLLTQRGQSFQRTGSFADTLAAITGPVTVVVPAPSELSQWQLIKLRDSRARLLLVAPGPAALAVLAPGVTVAGQAAVTRVTPNCQLAAAQAAGPALLGGTLYASGPPGGTRCYPPRPGGAAALVLSHAGGQNVTVLGSGLPLTNGALARAGDAALALNLLAGTHQVTWFMPPVAPPVPAAHGRPGLLGLIPTPAYLVALQLGLAALAAALWRARRLGPLVAEPMPVSVVATETVVGHGRLYRSRGARGQAAAALRAAALARLTARLGRRAEGEPEALRAEVARRTGRPPGEVGAVLSGPTPASDTALVRLADELDTLEGQVLAP